MPESARPARAACASGLPLKAGPRQTEPASGGASPSRVSSGMQPAPVQAAGGVVEQVAEEADHQDRRHQVGVSQPVAGIEAEIAQPLRNPEHLGGHQHDPDDPDGEPHAGEDVRQMPGSSTRSSVWMQVAERLRASSSQLASSWDTPAAVLSRIGHSAAKTTTLGSGTESNIGWFIGLFTDHSHHRRSNDQNLWMSLGEAA